jgi:hypothetical protein
LTYRFEKGLQVEAAKNENQQADANEDFEEVEKLFATHINQGSKVAK